MTYGGLNPLPEADDGGAVMAGWVSVTALSRMTAADEVPAVADALDAAFGPSAGKLGEPISR